MIQIEFLSAEFIIIATGIFLFGLAFGSFLNVCIYRMPRDLSVVHPRSACPSCREPIMAYDNIPVISWLLLGGRCRNCKSPISARYMIVELLVGVLFLACLWKFGFSWEAIKYCVFSFLIIGLIFTDAEMKLLPDKLTLPGLAIGILFSFVVPVDGFASFALLSNPVNLPDEALWRAVSLADALVGASVGALFLWVPGTVYKLLRGVEGMGFGDVKLMAMVGAFLGIKLTILTVLTAALAGSIAGGVAMVAVWIKRWRRWRRLGKPVAEARARARRSAQLIYRHYEMPFGVFLGAMAMFSVYFGSAFIHWYASFYQ